MTFGSPWGLALLVAVPLLVRLHRRNAPEVVRVASVRPYVDAAGAAPPARAARGADAVLVLVVAAAVCLACAAADPAFDGGPPVVVLRIDRRPSMSARTPAGGTVGESAVARARRLAAEAVSGAVLREVPWDAAGPDPAAPHGGVVVSDRLPDESPGAVVVGPSEPAAPNAGLVGAALVVGDDGPRVVVTVRNHSDAERVVSVLGPDGAALPVTVAPRSDASASFAAPARGGGASYSLAGSDSLAADDLIRVERRGGAAVARTIGCGPRLLAALRALGLAVVDAGPADVTVVVGGDGSAAAGPAVHFAAAPGGADSRVVPGAAAVAGASVTSRATGDFPLPAPATRLVATGRVLGGETIWEDAEGALVASDGDRVRIALDPEANGSDWTREGSFPAMVGAAIDRVTGGPDRVVATPGLPADGGRVAGAVSPDPDPAAILRAADVPEPVRIGGILAAVGACAAAAAAFLTTRTPRGARSA